MKLESLEENELISAIRREFSGRNPDLLLGIGDDAAVVKAGKKNLIFTKDLLVEDFHFKSSLHPPYFLGRKSLNINLSDIAAIGGRPRYALLGLALPDKMDPSWVIEYFSGLKSAARGSGVNLVGGDISEAKKIFISVTVVGEGKNILKRRGARPGDLLFVSGTLGDAKQGLILLKKAYDLGRDRKADALLKAFLDPRPQVSLGMEISRKKLASSMIDVSDGLSVDLSHLCQESGCGAEIDVRRLPLSPELRSWQRKAVDFALHGGEDYRLLFSVPPERAGSLSLLQKKYKLTFIGRMIKKKSLYLIDQKGKKKPLKIRGYQHFRRIPDFIHHPQK
ncbi:MAG: thiamine-phosphate kinase [Candidatus Aminicenantes bacterium]